MRTTGGVTVTSKKLSDAAGMNWPVTIIAPLALDVYECSFKLSCHTRRQEAVVGENKNPKRVYSLIGRA